MKKIYFSLCLLITTGISAQNLRDALRYSVEDLDGTARYKSLSGAMGAIGGDFSAIGTNPASGAVFAGSEIGFSLGDYRSKNKNTFFGTQEDNKASDFTLGQFGTIFTINNNNENSQWKKFAFGINYQQAKNFDTDDLKFRGVNTEKNLGDFFEYYADGIKQQDLLLEEYANKNVVSTSSISELYSRMGNAGGRAFRLRTALLGHYTGIIDPVIGRRFINPSDSDAFATAVLEETDYHTATPNSALTNYQRLTKGGINKYNFNFATQYGENLYIGLNLNSHRVNYSEITSHRENYDGSTGISHAEFTNELSTSGSGFSFQLGAIAKATENLRLGVAYQSPTWYTLEDETAQRLQVDNYYARPNVVVIYPEYKFRTAGAWTASAAYVFGKSAFINLDYIYRGYGNTYFRSPELKAENDIIENELKDANTIRIGGEYRIKGFSVRAGYRWEQSPYKNTKYIGDLNGYSFGAGYSFSGIRFDVSYDVSQRNNLFQMYESVITTPAANKLTNSKLLFTLSAKLF